jgi:hypothetical protein
MACFLLLVGGLATSSGLLFIVGAPLFLWLFKRHCTFSSVLPLLKRLRWLFLAVLILNLWFNSPEYTWLPTMTGVLLAVERVVALITMVLAAHLLLTTTTIQEIIAALQWWFRPLNKIGFPATRVAVRLALVLETVQTVQHLYLVTPLPNTTNAFQTISNRVAVLFAQVIALAENTPLRTLEIPELESPPWGQWFYPLVILVLIQFNIRML